MQIQCGEKKSEKELIWNWKIVSLKNSKKFQTFWISKIHKISFFETYENFYFWKFPKFFKPNFGFQNWKKSRNLLIFQIGQFQNFLIWKRPKTSNLEISKSPIWKIPKIVNLKNSKNSAFGKFRKIQIWKIQKIFNVENS